MIWSLGTLPPYPVAGIVGDEAMVFCCVQCLNAGMLVAWGLGCN